MPAFKFRLARVLGWYRKQGQLEEDRVRATLAEIARTEAGIAQLRETRKAAERGVVGAKVVQASELGALNAYREYSRREELALERTRARLKDILAEQRTRLKALRTRIRLLEKLGERRLTEHIIAEERELEELGADAFRAASFHSRAGTL